MAFYIGAALGGFSGRGSEFMEEKRDEAAKMVDASVKAWMETGLPEARKRKEMRRSQKKIAETLKNSYKLTNDQIGVILSQNKGQEVLDHFNKMQQYSPELLKKVGYKSSDVVSFAPSYEESGYTIDQILDSVMGKVNTGMSMSDALQDVTGKEPESGLAKIFSPNRSKLIEERMKAYKTTFGGDLLDEVRALAMDDITYEKSPFAGQIKLTDPFASAKAEQTLQGKLTGAFTSTSANKELVNWGNQITGGTAGLTASGEILYTPQIASRGIDVANIAQNVLAKYRKKLSRDKFTADEVSQMKAEIVGWAKENEIYEGGVQKEKGGKKDNAAGKVNLSASDANKQITNLTDAIKAGTIKLKSIDEQEKIIQQIADLILRSGQAKNQEEAERTATSLIIASRVKTNEPAKKESPPITSQNIVEGSFGSGA